MKLPDDPKERTQMLVLIGIGVIAAIYLVIQFGVLPILAKKKAMASRSEAKARLVNVLTRKSNRRRDKPIRCNNKGD